MAYSYSLSKGRPAPRHRSLSLVFLLLMVLTSLREAASARSVAALAPFESVQISVPFNVKISPAGNFSLNISADQQILNAINSSVSDKVLYVGTDKPFESQQPISATILLPAGSLQQVTVLSPNNLVAVDSGFSVQALSAKVAGTSTLYFKSLVAQQSLVTCTGYERTSDCNQAADRQCIGFLRVSRMLLLTSISCRTSAVFLSGNLGAVILKDFGVSNFYLQGQAQSVNLDLSGVSNAASAINSGIVHLWHCVYAISCHLRSDLLLACT